MLKKYFALFISIFFLVGCAPSQKSFTEKEINLKKLSIEKFGTMFHLIYNGEKSYSLAVKQERAAALNPNPLLQFFVFDMREEKIVFEDNLAGGKINWKTNDQVEVIVTPEIVSTDENNKIHGYIYDVRLKTKKDLNSPTQNPNR